MKNQNTRHPVQEHKQLRLALIATYPTMAEIFVDLAKEKGFKAYNVYESFEDAAQVAARMEKKVDAILSRGGTAHYIQKAVDIPVVFIPITPFDVVQTVHGLDSSIQEVALIHYRDEIPEVESIEKMYGVRIHQYTFLNYRDIEKAVQDAKAHGIKTIIGGQVGVGMAEKHGLTGIQIGAGKASVSRAIDEAVRIIDARNLEKRNTTRLRSIFDSLEEGVVATDENRKVMIYNDSAMQMFREKYHEGDILDGNIADDNFNASFNTKKPVYAVLRKFNNRMFMSNYRPIYQDDDFIGVISTFSDVTSIQKAEQKIRKEQHAKGFVARHRLQDIVTQNQEMQSIIQLAEYFAKTNSSVLIEGESGTGKELLAQGIHNASNRADGPFVAVNCAAIAENLLESELFGYEAGAFTGADKKGREGLFELAHNGTIFLDEIGEISMQLQTSLLRVLQEKEIRRVGGSKIIPIDVRVICATNKDLKSMVAEGTFRNDLYYRLNVLNLSILPLRQRKDDLPRLCKFILKEIDPEHGIEGLAEIMPMLQEYNWPGNIRELQNVMERFCVIRQLKNETYSKNMESLRRILGIREVQEIEDLSVGISLEGDLKDILHRVEKDVINYFLDYYNGDQDRVAERLGIGKSTLWRKRN